MPQKANSKFDMAVMRRRMKKELRKKHKKTISLSKANALWNDYCKYAVYKPLIRDGVAQLDNCTKLEIVGRQVINHPKAYAIMSTGNLIKGGIKSKLKLSPQHRRGFVYKIKLTDTTFNGGALIFEPCRKLKQDVYKALSETTKYYRIEA